MNNLSNIVFTHVIIDFDGSKIFLTTPEHDEIWKLSGSGKTSYQNKRLGIIHFSSCKKIITLEDFYAQYPHEIPTKYPKLPDEIPNNLDQRTPEEQKTYLARGRLSMIRGLQKFCDTHPGSKNAERVLHEAKSGLRMKNTFAKYF